MNNQLNNLSETSEIVPADNQYNSNAYNEYLECVKDMINHEKVLEMQGFLQHGSMSCLEHSISVSYKSFRICKLLHFDYASAARGGLLHDFFLYDWRDHETVHKGNHGYMHPRIALENANQYFMLNKKEQDIIKKHMWPLTIRFPRYKESFVVTCVDKYCAAAEFLNHSKTWLKQKFAFVTRGR